MRIGIDSNMSYLIFILDKIFTVDHRLVNLTGKPDVSAEPWINLHYRIKPTSKPSKTDNQTHQVVSKVSRC
jgi:hypothetical protein